MGTNNLATQTQLLLDVGYKFNWDFVNLGRAPIPDQPVRAGEWLIVSATEDSSPIPRQTMHRIKTIYQEGIRPLHWVVVHEAPFLLYAPKAKNKPRILPYIAILGGLGVLLATALITTATIVDPILIAITPEYDWIEIDRWYD
jgi:hypothetical protein